MSFEKYLGSIGGEQFSQSAAHPSYYGGYGNAKDPNYIAASNPNTKFGTNVSGVSPITGPRAGMYANYGGYRDSEGRFLGYGGDPNSLYNNSPDLQREYTEYVQNEPQRMARLAENQRVQAEYTRLQQEAIAQQRTQSLPTLANFNPAPQQFSGGLMGQQPQQPMQQQQQMPQPMQQQPMQQQGGLINYTHRGGMGGMGGTAGMAGGLHRGGLIAPSGSNGGGQ